MLTLPVLPIISSLCQSYCDSVHSAKERTELACISTLFSNLSSQTLVITQNAGEPKEIL
ncbi:hypothetical protein PPEP_b0756 [Pseudoalteromonas peptidolytica F12-50-A1]|uniref:Uncharacterized protein n=1 Tax=Pseudoalteromonas peptidolytica F12-50-A1 TaxID=1315280 RepID=A0A8I0N0Z0_9GAMM|nr:hypothetical protein [Pseudoalteromonas peptidolytica F12-50-A1]